MHLPHLKSFADIVEQVRDAFKQFKHEKESEAHQVLPSFQLKYVVMSFHISLDLSSSFRQAPTQRYSSIRRDANDS
jgi:hypothetical protein